MKHLYVALFVGVMMVASGCSDSQSVNVAEDADAAAIEEYNRLNQEGIDMMEEDDTDYNE
ncbi:hypothetical protein [Aporhodopirellula aestuarii]|uniref:Secreted protein n=1 Tax=Aporhodopirellula aestuarii TaxID=2950107 RepID=A0ABT0UCL9_9BACT|nr:hypothetical protein [Aporhodopirellula aestuarii]MCM2374484.1 hypothetical protein [Aporhodopirellula aestuarii]